MFDSEEKVQLTFYQSPQKIVIPSARIRQVQVHRYSE